MGEREERRLHRQLFRRRQQMRDAIDEHEGDDVFRGDDPETVAALRQEACRRHAFRLRELFQFAIASSRGFGEGGTHAIERGGQPRAIHGLQQIVERRQLERIDRVLIVGGAEDHRRPRPAERSRDIESACPRHLDVEQDQIG